MVTSGNPNIISSIYRQQESIQSICKSVILIIIIIITFMGFFNILSLSLLPPETFVLLQTGFTNMRSLSMSQATTQQLHGWLPKLLKFINKEHFCLSTQPVEAVGPVTVSTCEPAGRCRQLKLAHDGNVHLCKSFYKERAARSVCKGQRHNCC